MYRLSAFYFARTASDLPMDFAVPTIFLVIICESPRHAPLPAAVEGLLLHACLHLRVCVPPQLQCCMKVPSSHEGELPLLHATLPLMQAACGDTPWARLCRAPPPSCQHVILHLLNAFL